MNMLKQSGVSLIEILITTLILGIGLLGVAALQVSSVTSNQEGFFTTQATSIAEDYASRIRSGRLVTTNYDPNSTDTASVRQINYISLYATGAVLACGATPPTMCRSNNGAPPAATCTSAQMAAFDAWEICDIAKNTLPLGQVRAVRNTNRVTIVVDWEPASARADFGIKENLNSNCETLGVAATRNCVIMEIVP